MLMRSNEKGNKIMMKILSIDFDFFQNVKQEVIKTAYPDGIDISTDLSNLVWKMHYAYYPELFEISVLEDQLNKLKKILLNQKRSCKVMIANSHVHIYDFIHDNVTVGDKLSLVNIDMHHDMMNENPELDCGNWIQHIIDDYGTDKVGLRWIANPVSLKVYGFTKEELSKVLIPSDLHYIEDEAYDMIFLCRSDPWVPPHLDTYFQEITALILKQFDMIKAEKGIMKTRKIRG